MKYLPYLALSALLLLSLGCGRSGPRPGPGPSGPASGLPLPSQTPRDVFQPQLFRFLGARTYLALGWRGDKRLRDTGPYLNGTYYGTHPAVRIYYSPEVITWLEGGRTGELPDGSMIIKEMYPPPAARYADGEAIVPTQWTVMIRDKAGAYDGWYWTYFSSNPDNLDPPVPQEPDNDEYPFKYPDSSFGAYCVRCHASAVNTLTFVSTENIEGFPGEPKTYEVDDSWMVGELDPTIPHPNEIHDPSEIPASTLQALSEATANQEFLAYFDQFPAAERATVDHLPGESTDLVVAKAHRQFTSSSQCMSCHSGDTSPFGPNMVLNDTDLSPHGEWRWSMMGLAGRDPIFYAQMETEAALHAVPGGDFSAQDLQNFCLRCHGVMGQRQFTQDFPDQLFSTEIALSYEEESPHRDYGGLARDGISCAVCHQIQDQSGVPLSRIETGKFLVSPAQDGLLDIFGPFEDPTLKPMAESLGMRARHSKHVGNSLLCASCHTVNLPVLDQHGKTIGEKYEQATYLEWVNSSYAGGSGSKSCQDCHMPRTYHNEPLEFKIANTQDQDFPEADGVSPPEEITVLPRKDYSRHTLSGINVFALEFFKQYPDILGVRTKSFMTGLENGLDNSIANSLEVAANSATLEVLQSDLNGSNLEAELKITNLAGHRFPSGVGFRRLFLEVLVYDANENLVWGSGRSNELGVLVDAAGTPLPSEDHSVDPITGEQAFQPHHLEIDSQDQVQIYEELIKDDRGRFNTSFLARVDEVKDNRLLPKGWSASGSPTLEHKMNEATLPIGIPPQDTDFVDGSGSDRILYKATLPNDSVGPYRVQAKLYYQAIPPRYLKDRFTQAQGPATRRLHYMASRLNLQQTAFPGWKLPVAEVSVSVE